MPNKVAGECIFLHDSFGGHKANSINKTKYSHEEYREKD